MMKYLAKFIGKIFMDGFHLYQIIVKKNNNNYKNVDSYVDIFLIKDKIFIVKVLNFIPRNYNTFNMIFLVEENIILGMRLILFLFLMYVNG